MAQISYSIHRSPFSASSVPYHQHPQGPTCTWVQGNQMTGNSSSHLFGGIEKVKEGANSGRQFVKGADNVGHTFRHVWQDKAN